MYTDLGPSSLRKQWSYFSGKVDNVILYHGRQDVDYICNLLAEYKMEKPSSSLLIGNVDNEKSSTNKLEVQGLCVEPQQMSRKKKGKGFNLRKSLAWDRAFFTEEGVLNPTELSWITGDVLSVRDVNTSGSKRSGCPQPVSSSSTKRVARVSATKTPHKESKLSKIPVTKSSQSTLTSKSATPAERQSKRNQIPQPPKFQNSRSRAPSLSGYAAHNTDTLGSVKKSLPAKSSVQHARRNLRTTDVQSRPVSRKDIGTQFDPIPGISVRSQLSNGYADGSSRVATFPPSADRNSSGIMQNAKLRMAKPSGLRKPSPSLGYFNQHRTSSSHDKLSRVLQPSNPPPPSTSHKSRVGTLNMTGKMGLPIAAGSSVNASVDAVASEKSVACVFQPGSFATCSMPSNLQVCLQIPGQAKCLPQDDVLTGCNIYDPVIDSVDCPQHWHNNKLSEKSTSLGVGSSFRGSDGMANGQIHLREQAYCSETYGKVKCFLKEDEPGSSLSCTAIVESVDNKLCGAKSKFSGLSASSESTSSFTLRDNEISGHITFSNLKSPKTGGSCDSSMEVNDHIEDNIRLNENEGSETYDSHFSEGTILLGESQNFEDKSTAKMSAVLADPFSISKYDHMEGIEKEVLEVYGTSPEPFLGNVPQRALNKNSSTASNELSFVGGLCKHSAGHPEFQKPSNLSEVDQDMAVECFNEQLDEKNISEAESILEQCDGSWDKSEYQYVSTHLEHVLQDGHTDVGGTNVFPQLNSVNISSVVQSSSSSLEMESSHHLVNGAANSELDPISQSNYQTSGAVVVNSSSGAFLGNEQSDSLDKREEILTDGCIMQEVVNVSNSNTLPTKTNDSFSHSSCSIKCDVHCNLLDSNNKIEKENATTSPDIRKSYNERKPGALMIKPPANAVPFSDEWLAALEAAGEDILAMKGGAVQNSPPEKSLPEPSPWSPVRRKNNQGIGPYDCTKYTGTNISNSDSHLPD